MGQPVNASCNVHTAAPWREREKKKNLSVFLSRDASPERCLLYCSIALPCRSTRERDARMHKKITISIYRDVTEYVLSCYIRVVQSFLFSFFIFFIVQIDRFWIWNMQQVFKILTVLTAVLPGNHEKYSFRPSFSQNYPYWMFKSRYRISKVP